MYRIVVARSFPAAAKIEHRPGGCLRPGKRLRPGVSHAGSRHDPTVGWTWSLRVIRRGCRLHEENPVKSLQALLKCVDSGLQSLDASFSRGRCFDRLLRTVSYGCAVGVSYFIPAEKNDGNDCAEWNIASLVHALPLTLISYIVGLTTVTHGKDSRSRSLASFTHSTSSA
jgi:hypothetical protein